MTADSRTDGPDEPTTEEDEEGRFSRRTLLGGAVSVLALAGAGGAGLYLTTDRASADVATGALTISGDTALTDAGQLTSLTVSISDGHVSYDGLDTPADSLDVNLHAVPSGAGGFDAGSTIATQTFAVAGGGLDTRAGHTDYTFSGADALSSDQLTSGDFTNPGDGTSGSTDVDFHVELIVKDSGGGTIITAAETATATITVDNQAQSAAINGTGSTAASGPNQQPTG